MTEPLVVQIPHRLGKQEAGRRLKTEPEHSRCRYSRLIQLNEEVWSGDRLVFAVLWSQDRRRAICAGSLGNDAAHSPAAYADQLDTIEDAADQCISCVVSEADGPHKSGAIVKELSIYPTGGAAVKWPPPSFQAERSPSTCSEVFHGY